MHPFLVSNIWQIRFKRQMQVDIKANRYRVILPISRLFSTGLSDVAFTFDLRIDERNLGTISLGK